MLLSKKKGSSKKGGDLGFFRKGKMSAAFEQCAFNLELLEISRVVATSSGVHLIMRVG
jgi:parvulin-like peptidyl-prolyl isomerase